MRPFSHLFVVGALFAMTGCDASPEPENQPSGITESAMVTLHIAGFKKSNSGAT